MNDVLKKLALSLVNKQIAAHRDELHAFVDAQLDACLDKGAAAVDASDLPVFVEATLIGALNDPDVRRQLHALVDGEVDKLLAELVARLSA